MKPRLQLLVSAIVTLALSTSLLSLAAPPATSPPKDGLRLSPEITVNTYMGLVEEYLEGVLRTAKVIASTTEARSSQWESVKPVLEKWSKELSTNATIWYALPDGTYHSLEGNLSPEQNLKDRDYFAKLLRGQDILGNLVISKSTGHRSLVVATPVLEKGKVAGIVGVSVRARLLTQLVQDHLKLPDNSYFYAVNPNAKISMHQHIDRMFQQVGDVGDESLEKEFKVAFKKDHGRLDYDLKVKKMTSIYQKSAPLGWYFFIAQETDSTH